MQEWNPSLDFIAHVRLIRSSVSPHQCEEHKYMKIQMFCVLLPRAVERVGEHLWTSVSAFWVGNVWTLKRLHECLLSLYLLLATALLLHRHHRPLFLLLLSFFPWCSGLLIAVLAADVADGRLSSRAGRQSVPLLLLPRWPPQLLVGVGRRAAGKDGHSQTELTSLRARTDEPSRRSDRTHRSRLILSCRALRTWLMPYVCASRWLVCEILEALTSE